MQELTPADLDLKEISADASLPTEEVEKHIDSFARAETWRDALIRYGLYGPPSGVFESNRDAVEEIAREAPLISLIPKQVVGQHMAPILKAGTEEERRDLDLTEYEALQLRAWAPIAAEIVHRIRVRHGTPERGELVDFFVTDAIDVATADRVADAVLRFWEGDYDAAAHVLVPRLEAIIRSLCLRAGIVVIREPVGAKPGGVVGLGALLDDLNGRLDESWRRYLVNLLTEVVGLNLRNVVAHALRSQVTQGEAALLVHAACHLRLLDATVPESEPDR